MARINKVRAGKEEEDWDEVVDLAEGLDEEAVDIPEFEDPLDCLDSLMMQVGEFAQDSLARARRDADDTKRRDTFLKHAVSMTTTLMKLVEFTEKRRPAPMFVRGKHGK